MNSQQFELILAKRLDLTKKVLGSKAKEYAVGDRLYNFKRAAEIERTTPEKALLGMMAKHLVSVIDLIEGNVEVTEYLVNEKIGDSINYHILLEALLLEKIGVEAAEPNWADIPQYKKGTPIPRKDMSVKEREAVNRISGILGDRG
jgi:hypothetical protein